MITGRRIESVPRRDRTRTRPAAGAVRDHEHPILALQAQAGNKAVTAFLQRQGGEFPVPGQVGNQAVTALLRRSASGGGASPGASGSTPVQRQVGVAEEEAAHADPEVQIAGIVNAQVGALPALEEAALPPPDHAEAARDEAQDVADDLEPLGLAGFGPVADWYRAEMGDQGARDAAPVAEELADARGDVDLPAPPQPGFFSRAGTAIKGAFSAIGGAIKGAFSRENRRDVGAKSPIAGGVASVAGAHLDYAAAAGRSIVDNQATVGAAGLVGGTGAAGKVQEAGGQMGQVAHAASSTTPTLEHPGDFARSFTSGAFELTHQVASVVGIFFSALKAALDTRSLVSSVRVIRGLKAAKARALASGASPEVVAAVDYAISQKYEKVIKRAIGAAGALAGLGVALAILIANPAGASLAAIIIGGVGASVFLYKMGRWAWKKWNTKSLGRKRTEVAQRLFNQIRARDALALDAVRSLHLDPEVVSMAPNGAALIARKLKSS